MFYFPACNRTYYGEIEQTYDLELHRPKEPKIPYICHLTFTANGGEFGDIVQVMLLYIRYKGFNQFSTKCNWHLYPIKFALFIL